MALVVNRELRHELKPNCEIRRYYGHQSVINYKLRHADLGMKGKQCPVPCRLFRQRYEIFPLQILSHRERWKPSVQLVLN